MLNIFTLLHRKKAGLLAAIISVVCLITACNSLPKDEYKELRGNTAQTLLCQGQQAEKAGNLNKAIKCYEAVVMYHPFTAAAQTAQLGLVKLHYQNNDALAANTAAIYYLQLYPNAAQADYVYYIKGLIHIEKDRTWLQKVYNKHAATLDLSNAQIALINFETIINSFPNSRYLAAAQKQVNQIYELFANKELAIAQFYFKRQAYLAAMNRANFLLKNFPTTNASLAAKQLIENIQAHLTSKKITGTQ